MFPPGNRRGHSSSGVEADGGYLSHRFDSGKTPPDFIGLPQVRHWHGGCRPERIEKFSKGQTHMPLKPNGALCRVREQIIEDAASGLTLQFECDDGRLRLVLAGTALTVGNREILFDEQGREAGAGTLLGEFRRPNWLKRV
jgi:hypothetical protein